MPEEETNQNSSNVKTVSPKSETVTPENFEDSSILQYSCTIKSSNENNKLEKGAKKNASEELIITGYRESNDIQFCDSSLKKIYSLDFSRSNELFCSGGDRGWVAIYGINSKSVAKPKDTKKKDKDDEDKDDEDKDDEDKDEDKDKDDEDENNESPLCSWRSHESWVSCCAFLSDTNDKLITSSNDRTIRLWDLNKQGGTLRCVVYFNKIDFKSHLTNCQSKTCRNFQETSAIVQK